MCLEISLPWESLWLLSNFPASTLWCSTASWFVSPGYRFGTPQVHRDTPGILDSSGKISNIALDHSWLADTNGFVLANRKLISLFSALLHYSSKLWGFCYLFIILLFFKNKANLWWIKPRECLPRIPSCCLKIWISNSRDAFIPFLGAGFVPSPYFCLWCSPFRPTLCNIWEQTKRSQLAGVEESPFSKL